MLAFADLYFGPLVLVAFSSHVDACNWRCCERRRVESHRSLRRWPCQSLFSGERLHATLCRLSGFVALAVLCNNCNKPYGLDLRISCRLRTAVAPERKVGGIGWVVVPQYVIVFCLLSRLFLIYGLKQWITKSCSGNLLLQLVLWGCLDFGRQRGIFRFQGSWKLFYLLLNWIYWDTSENSIIVIKFCLELSLWVGIKLRYNPCQGVCMLHSFGIVWLGSLTTRVVPYWKCLHFYYSRNFFILNSVTNLAKILHEPSQSSNLMSLLSSSCLPRVESFPLA